MRAKRQPIAPLHEDAESGIQIRTISRCATSTD